MSIVLSRIIQSSFLQTIPLNCLLMVGFVVFTANAKAQSTDPQETAPSSTTTKVEGKQPTTIHEHYIARMNDAGANALEIMNYNHKISLGVKGLEEPKWMPEIEVFRDLIENAPSHTPQTKVYGSIVGMVDMMYITESGAMTTQEKGQKEVYHPPLFERFGPAMEKMLGWVEEGRATMAQVESKIQGPLFNYIDENSTRAIAFNPMDDIDVMAKQAGLTGDFSNRPALFAKVAFIEAAQAWANQQGYKNVDLSGVVELPKNKK